LPLGSPPQPFYRIQNKEVRRNRLSCGFAKKAIIDRKEAIDADLFADSQVECVKGRETLRLKYASVLAGSWGQLDNIGSQFQQGERVSPFDGVGVGHQFEAKGCAGDPLNILSDDKLQDS
jgi:hypothetical protein